MMLSYTEPRCSRCLTMLVHAGALCVKCDDQMLYTAPIRTSPPLQLPESDSFVTPDTGATPRSA